MEGAPTRRPAEAGHLGLGRGLRFTHTCSLQLCPLPRFLFQPDAGSGCLRSDLSVPSLPVLLADVEAAAERLQEVAVRTPLIRLPLEGEVYVKPESLQRTGSFKFRGAFNALASTPFAAIERGVVADSSGNHAQGVAAAAALLGVPATIVMPENAAPVKVARTAAYGAEIVRCANSSEERQSMAAEIRDARSLEYIPPFDDTRIIAGQGTVGLEVARDLSDVGTVVVCVGGGGLISGVATAVRGALPRRPGDRVEPELAADAQESLREGRIVSWPAADVTRTICDGVRTQALGELTFATISALVDEIVTVPEDAVLEAMRWLALEAKLVVEPTGALTLAALRTGAVSLDGPTVLVVSGGNVDPALAATVLAGDLPLGPLSRSACPPAAPGESEAAVRRDRRARVPARSPAAPRRARSGPREPRRRP